MLVAQTIAGSSQDVIHNTTGRRLYGAAAEGALRSGNASRQNAGQRRLKGQKAVDAVNAGIAKYRARPASDPPRYWTNNGLNLRTILFGIEKSRLDLQVVIGPVGFGGRPSAPERIEHGVGRYRKRAFMGPALEAKRDQLLESLLKFGVI